MKRIALALWNEEQGFLTFEWILLLTLLAIGVVGGLAAARDSIIDELGDVSEAVVSFDQSYTLAPFNECGVQAPGFSFPDSKPSVARTRPANCGGQTAHQDCNPQ